MKRIETLELVSSKLGKRLVALYNQFDESWEYYHCLDFIPKNNLDPRNRLEGYRITEYVENFESTSFDSESFKLRFDKDIMRSELEFNHDKFLVVKGVLES